MADQTPKPKKSRRSKPRAGPPLDTPPDQPRIKASLDDDVRAPLAGIRKMRDAIEGRNATVGDAIKKLIGPRNDAFEAAIAKLQPKIDYSALQESMRAVIDQASDSNARLSEAFRVRTPDLGLADRDFELELVPPPMSEEQRTILLATGEHVEATARLMGTLVTLTEEAYNREAKAGARLNRLTLVLVVLTFVLALPELRHFWNDVVAPFWESVTRGTVGN